MEPIEKLIVIESDDWGSVSICQTKEALEEIESQRNFKFTLSEK